MVATTTASPSLMPAPLRGMVALKSAAPGDEGVQATLTGTAPAVVLRTWKVSPPIPPGARAVAAACKVKPANELAPGLVTATVGFVTSLQVTDCGSHVCDELHGGRHCCETQTPVPSEWSQVAPGPHS